MNSLHDSNSFGKGNTKGIKKKKKKKEEPKKEPKDNYYMFSLKKK